MEMETGYQMVISSNFGSILILEDHAQNNSILDHHQSTGLTGMMAHQMTKHHVVGLDSMDKPTEIQERMKFLKLRFTLKADTSTTKPTRQLPVPLKNWTAC